MSQPPGMTWQVENCPYRRPVSGAETDAFASCELVDASLCGLQSEEPVPRNACEACCRSFPPSPGRMNPVVASLVFARAGRLVSDLAPGADADRLNQAIATARECLDFVYQEPLELTQAETPGGPALESIVPPPRQRHGPRVQSWAVGVTTAPRIRPTLETCLDSLIRAGWHRPHLFIDAAVHIPEPFQHLPYNFRAEPIGAWPSYYLALSELLLRYPRADAYLIVQDDALCYTGQSLTRYLEGVLWPGKRPGLASLYCAEADRAEQPGWHALDRPACSGPVALAFPRELAKAFLTDRAVLEHRWHPDERAATAIGGLISRWAYERGLPIWLPTPSLVQHLGETSTLWPRARALGPYRSSAFAGTLKAGFNSANMP